MTTTEEADRAQDRAYALLRDLSNGRLPGGVKVPMAIQAEAHRVFRHFQCSNGLVVMGVDKFAAEAARQFSNGLAMKKETPHAQ